MKKEKEKEEEEGGGEGGSHQSKCDAWPNTITYHRKANPSIHPKERRGDIVIDQ